MVAEDISKNTSSECLSVGGLSLVLCSLGDKVRTTIGEHLLQEWKEDWMKLKEDGVRNQNPGSQLQLSGN